MPRPTRPLPAHPAGTSGSSRRRGARLPRLPRRHAGVGTADGTAAVRRRRRPRAAAGRPDALRARTALIGLYGLLGLTVASWLSRLPTVRTELGLSTGEFGAVMLVGSLGSLATVLVAGAVAARWGSRRTMMVAGATFAAASVALGLGPTIGSVPVLLVGVVLMSASFALGNVPLNLESVIIERAIGRTVVPHFHAAFSIGSVVGSGLGALAAWGHLPLLVHFTVIGAVSLVWRWHSIPLSVLPVVTPRPTAGAPAVSRRGGAAREALAAWREPRTLLLGLIVMAGALSEGTANGWLAIAVVDGFARTEAIGAVVFGVFVASMTVSRSAGTTVIDRFGRWPVLVVSGVLGLAGLLLFGLAPSFAIAVVGVVAWGLGAGLIIPITMAVVAGEGLGAAGRVAVVSAFASVTGLVAPPVIGIAAESIGIRHAVLLIAVVLVLGIVITRGQRAAFAGGPARPALPAEVPDAGVPDGAEAVGRSDGSPLVRPTVGGPV